MKSIQKITQLLVFLFFGISLVFFMSFDTVKGLWGREELSTSLVTSFLWIGVLIYLISLGISRMATSRLERELSKKELEKNELKAKLYDLEQSLKLKTIEKKLETKEPEKEAKGIRPRQNLQ